MTDEEKNVKPSYYSSKAVGYIIYSRLAITIGAGNLQPDNKYGFNIAIKGLNTAKSMLATTYVSADVMDNILLKDKNFLQLVENKYLFVKNVGKNKEREIEYMISTNGINEIMEEYNISLKKDIEEKEIELIKERNKKPETATLNVLVEGVPLKDIVKD